MAIITLTTDFGIKDHFIGAMKGAILSELPDANIVDISHNISPFNITETAYVLKNAYKYFPKGAIHIVDVDSELSPENEHIAVLLDGHYFVCTDNGVVSMISATIKPEKMVRISIHHTLTSHSAFVKVACHIARGGKLEVVGNKTDTLKQLNEVYPHINPEGNQIVGTIIYIDNYGNVITNITKSVFNNVGKGRDFQINFRNQSIDKIFEKYNQVVNFDLPKEKRHDEGKKLALFNEAGYLEIAIYKSDVQTVGGASTLFGLAYRDTITVNFTA
ncbi:MAG: hypothetical protein CSA39_02035 [Flavobacteriales bacterium]|nr:MAG: hypothetical protein CR985_02930 [Flavobacteriales bacterium]PIE49560.1 MAG: hypothetical protein CSA39_02035 [Flavobacteriales bacterium]